MPIVGDPGRSAVLALHYQNEVLHPDGAIRLGVAEGDAGRGGVVAAAAALLEGARVCGVPVIHVRIAFRDGYRDVIRNCAIFRNVVVRGAMVEESWGAAFHAGLGPAPGEAVLTHTRISAFYGTDLHRRLDAMDVGHLVIAGVATNSVVETTGRHAADVGWMVTVARDACSAADPALHSAALSNMALLGEVASAGEIVDRAFRPMHAGHGA